LVEENFFLFVIRVFIFFDKFQEIQLKVCEQQIINISLGSQKNSFYPMSNNLDIMIISHLRRVVSRMEILFFTRKKHE